jgi:AI-2 transport protein TqsA
VEQWIPSWQASGSSNEPSEAAVGTPPGLGPLDAREPVRSPARSLAPIEPPPAAEISAAKATEATEATEAAEAVEGTKSTEIAASTDVAPFNGMPTNEVPAANGLPTRYEFSAFLTQHVGNIMTHLSAALMDLLSSAMMVLIFMFFLLLGDSAASLPRHGVWNEIQAGIRNYIVTKTLISIVTGAVFGVVLWFFGIPLALVFGLLAFLLNFIPNIGPIIASLLPLPLILLHPQLSFWSMLAVIALTSGVQFISGNVIEPKIMGDSFRLHPVVILLTLMFWGMLWGIVGMFLATPITAALKVFFEEFEPTRPIARWMEGRFDWSERPPVRPEPAASVGTQDGAKPVD